MKLNPWIHIEYQENNTLNISNNFKEIPDGERKTVMLILLRFIVFLVDTSGGYKYRFGDKEKEV